MPFLLLTIEQQVYLWLGWKEGSPRLISRAEEPFYIRASKHTSTSRPVVRLLFDDRKKKDRVHDA